MLCMHVSIYLVLTSLNTARGVRLIALDIFTADKYCNTFFYYFNLQKTFPCHIQ